MNTILDTERLTIGYFKSGRRQQVVAGGFNLALDAGELVALMGPNGCGKSTLLRTLSNLQKPLAGTVRIGGRSLADFDRIALARKVAVVLTERQFPAYLTVARVVEFGRIPYTNRWGTIDRHHREIIDWALRETGTWSLRERNMVELSDGEKQKVMIARALAQDPEVLLLDEPGAFLDLVGKIEILSLLKRIAHQKLKAVLLSTHDFETASRLVDRVWLMQPDGRMSSGAPEDLILSRAFDAVFRKNGIRFDIDSGSFQIDDRNGMTVGFAGQGPAAGWTLSALKRAGFKTETADAASSIHIRLKTDGDHLRWQITGRQGKETVDSIHALIQYLRMTCQPEPKPRR